MLVYKVIDVNVCVCVRAKDKALRLPLVLHGPKKGKNLVKMTRTYDI